MIKNLLKKKSEGNKPKDYKKEKKIWSKHNPKILKRKEKRKKKEAQIQNEWFHFESELPISKKKKKKRRRSLQKTANKCTTEQFNACPLWPIQTRTICQSTSAVAAASNIS